MKGSKIAVVTVLAIFILFGWITAFKNFNAEDNSEYNKHIEMAKKYDSRGLYQKAIAEYKAAIDIVNNEEDYSLMFESYSKRYKEDKDIYYDYLDDAKQAVKVYEDNVEYISTLVNLYIEENDYKSAYNQLLKSLDNGITDKKIQKLYLEVKYAYEIGWNTYTDFRPLSKGYYAVNVDENNWGYTNKDGSSTDFINLKFAGPVGEADVFVISDGERSKLIDMQGVVQGYLDFVPTDTGFYSQELIPIHNGKTYSYYNSLGDKEFGEYQFASTFTDEKAAVKQDNKWFFIDSKGKKTSKKDFADIILNQEQKYILDGVMLAKEKNEYKIYNADEETISKFSCLSIDILTEDGLIAYSKNGKWGFVDIEGNVVIEPKYQEAKSFSNGLGAVYNGDKWGFINKEGTLVIGYNFLDVDYFNDKGCCIVKTEEDKWQLLSLNIFD